MLVADASLPPNSAFSLMVRLCLRLSLLSRAKFKAAFDCPSPVATSRHVASSPLQRLQHFSA